MVAGRGAQRAGARVAAVSEFAVVGVDLRLPQHYRNRLEKFDLINPRGFATQCHNPHRKAPEPNFGSASAVAARLDWSGFFYRFRYIWKSFTPNEGTRLK